ncbi:TPM domain-containing protein [Paenibacillus lupini]|uniref:TPM domain-containing protein n=1 Tax=Paenibacillus lupini TaxID=1450204 RepID=UPI001421CDA6|nr:TPM domain-containing protein [Paenibacillus lupini]NIK21490.1 septation ring formation regulator EzrA [Paenibacillus lupini]
MKKTIFLTILLFLCVFAGMVSAASLPDKGTPHIYDTAGMIPSEQLKDLEMAAGAGAPYMFYILTIDSLDGEESDVYAKNVYDTWSLQADDIIVLLSKTDRRIQLYFMNVPLQKKLDALPIDYAGSEYTTRQSIDRFLGKNFTPMAKQGDFGSGLLQMVSAMNVLPEPEVEAPIQPATPDPLLVAPPSQHSPLQVIPDLSQREPVNAGRFPLISIIVIISLVILAAGLYVLIRFKKRTTLKRNVLSLAEDTSVELFRAQETLKPLVQLYGAPPSAEVKLLPLSRAIDQQAQIVQQLIVSISNLHIGIVTRKGTAELDQFAKTVSDQNNHAKQHSQSANELAELDQTNNQIVKEMQAVIQALSGRVSELANVYQLSLRMMRNEIEVNKEKTDAVYKQQLSELIDATELLIPQHEQTTLHNQLLDKLPDFIAEQKSGLAKINELEASIKAQMQQNQLQLVEFNPFERTAYAAVEHKQLIVSLENGDLRDASDRLANIRGALDIARQMVPQRLELRASVMQDMERMKKFVQSFSLNEEAFQEELRKMKSKFHPSVWTFMPPKYEEAVQTYRDVVSYSETTTLAINEQRYNASREQLDNMITLSEQATLAMKDCMLAYDRSLQHLAGIQHAHSDTWRKFQTADTLLTAQHLSPQSGPGSMLNNASDIIRKDKERLDHHLASNQISLDDAESQQQSIDRNVNTFVTDVERVVQEKQQAERRIREIQNRYESVYARTRHRSVSSNHSSSYQSNMSQIDNLIMLGLYMEAMNLIDDADHNINQMQFEYDNIIREEQRQEDERRRQEEEQRRQQESISSSPSPPSSGGDSYSPPSGSSGGDNW